jgi:phosphoribosylglycinamide formyltransferase-1
MAIKLVIISLYLSPVKNIIIFASGAGSNAKKIIEYFTGETEMRVVLIVCNNAGAGVLKIAEDYKIPTLLIEKENFFHGDHYLPQLKQYSADLVVLAGFLWKIPHALIEAYPRRIINIHPALLPKYGGKGMYGLRVHEAVIRAGEKESGITIHYVDGHYDNGDIIFQARCPVKPQDTPETLAQRVHKLEHEYYVGVIEGVVKGEQIF